MLSPLPWVNQKSCNHVLKSCVLGSRRSEHRTVRALKFMKNCYLRYFVSLLAGCLLLSSSNHALAQTPGALLTQAYAALASADHDYKGHRVEAMKQVEAAAKLLGVNVRGDGHGHEKQGVSDEQLRTASGLLEQARPALKGKALHHVNRALKDISTALKIK